MFAYTKERDKEQSHPKDERYIGKAYHNPCDSTCSRSITGVTDLHFLETKSCKLFQSVPNCLFDFNCMYCL